ncbi:hypothetical protein DAETH_06460 [Deinococcus aetherius]|uniref:Uncharacterized protein n=1 Tax=Deinococcus aetherius TaxID=200252 RepID=A0ABN6RBJ1_9DEIO|nr:hypothetical protein [Deinococcus aetherius]BDP40677.1 hypothetical protein DAETH_06460 [Deinococcus aetherius]
MSVLVLLLLGVAGWAAASSRRPRTGQEVDRGWKAPSIRTEALGKLAFPNRPPGRGRPGARLLPAPFRPGDIVRVDGEWYHLPTLLRLHHAGRLAWGSPSWRALEQAGRRERGRLN